MDTYGSQLQPGVINARCWKPSGSQRRAFPGRTAFLSFSEYINKEDLCKIRGFRSPGALADPWIGQKEGQALGSTCWKGQAAHNSSLEFSVSQLLLLTQGRGTEVISFSMICRRECKDPVLCRMNLLN